MKANYASIDITKFIMSLFVVAIHVNPLGAVYGELRFPITRIAVPTFFLISSYLLFGKIKEIESEKKRIILRFCRRNLQLYFTWFIVLFPFTVYIREYYKMTVPLFIKEIITQFVFKSTFPASWYIVAQVIGVVLVVCLCRYIKNIGVLAVGLTLYFLCCLASNYRGLLDNSSILIHFVESIPGAIYNSFPVSIVWIGIGKVMAENSEYIKNIKISRKLLATNMAIVLLIFEHLIIQRYNLSYVNDCYLFLLLVCPFLLSCILSIRTERNNVTRTLQTMSSVMYCSHLVFGKIFSFILKKLSVDVSSLWGASILFVAVVIACIILSLFIDRLKKYRHLAWLRFLQ